MENYGNIITCSLCKIKNAYSTYNSIKYKSTLCTSCEKQKVKLMQKSILFLLGSSTNTHVDIVCHLQRLNSHGVHFGLIFKRLILDFIGIKIITSTVCLCCHQNLPNIALIMGISTCRDCTRLSNLVSRCPSKFENKKCSTIITKQTRTVFKNIRVRCNNYISSNASKYYNTRCKEHRPDRRDLRCGLCRMYYTCDYCRCCPNHLCDNYKEDYC
jgi:hypothetical protein